MYNYALLSFVNYNYTFKLYLKLICNDMGGNMMQNSSGRGVVRSNSCVAMPASISTSRVILEYQCVGITTVRKYNASRYDERS